MDRLPLNQRNRPFETPYSRARRVVQAGRAAFLLARAEQETSLLVRRAFPLVFREDERQPSLRRQRPRDFVDSLNLFSEDECEPAIPLYTDNDGSTFFSTRNQRLRRSWLRSDLRRIDFVPEIELRWVNEEGRHRMYISASTDEEGIEEPADVLL
jgi:hypothetical protein